MKAKLADARKAVVAAVGVAAQLVALGVLHGVALHIAQVVVAAATAAGVYAAPNGPVGKHEAGHADVLLTVCVLMLVLVALIFFKVFGLIS